MSTAQLSPAATLRRKSWVLSATSDKSHQSTNGTTVMRRGVSSFEEARNGLIPT